MTTPRGRAQLRVTSVKAASVSFTIAISVKSSQFVFTWTLTQPHGIPSAVHGRLNRLGTGNFPGNGPFHNGDVFLEAVSSHLDSSHPLAATPLAAIRLAATPLAATPLAATSLVATSTAPGADGTFAGE